MEYDDTKPINYIDKNITKEEKLEQDSRRLLTETRKFLRLDSNPLIEAKEEQFLNNVNAINKYKDISPLHKVLSENIDKKTKELEIYKEAQKNSSSNNLIKSGTKGIFNLGNQQILLTGKELITEDLDNIYIDDQIIPKKRTERYSLEEKYSEKELEFKRENNPKYRAMTDEEWLKEIKEVKEHNYSLNKIFSNQMQVLREAVPDDLRKEIDYMEPMGIEEYTYLKGFIKNREPIIEKAINKINTGENITPEEFEVLNAIKYIYYSMERRGVSFGAEVFTGVQDLVKENFLSTLAMITTDIAISTGLTALSGITAGATTPLAATKIGATVIKYGRMFNKATKTHKTLKYASKALKYIGLHTASAGVDTMLKTYIFDKTPLLGTTKEERIRNKKLNRTLGFTDKGEMVVSRLSQDMENFLEYQDNVEQYNENLTERIVDPIVDMAINALPIPKSISNSFIIRGLKKINKIPRVAGTTFSGLGTEHLEETVGMALNYMMKANDPETTLGDSIREYYKPENFALNTLNIMISGGIVHGVSNAITGNLNEKETESINRTIVKNYFKKKFEDNPDLILKNEDKGIDQYNYESQLDSLSETSIDKLAKKVFEKEDKESQERYNTRLEEIRQNLINNNIEETEANNLVKIYDAVYSQSAINYGVNRYDIANKIKLEFKMKDEESNSNETENYDQAMKPTEKDFNTFFEESINNKRGDTEYYRTKGEIQFDISEGIIRHDNNKHKTTKDDWKQVMNAINSKDNIINYTFSNKKGYYGDKNILLNIKINNEHYGIAIATPKGRNIITTLFKDNPNSIDNWIENEKKTSVTQPTENINLPAFTDANSIVNYLKSNVNKNNNESYNQESYNKKESYGIPYRIKKYEDLKREIINNYKNKSIEEIEAKIEEISEKSIEIQKDTYSPYFPLNYFEVKDRKKIKELYKEFYKKSLKTNDDVYNFIKELQEIKHKDFLTKYFPDYLKRIEKNSKIEEEHNKLYSIQEELREIKNTIDEKYLNSNEYVLKRIAEEQPNSYISGAIYSAYIYTPNGFILRWSNHKAFHSRSYSDYEINENNIDEVLNKIKDKKNEYNEKDKNFLLEQENYLTLFQKENLTDIQKFKILSKSEIGRDIYYQTAYHGSPYNFDKFTLDHIGEGEGAQAHGYGLYFALDKKVAEKYRNNLTNNKEKDYKYKNKPLIEYRDQLEKNKEFDKLEIIDELLLRENIKEIEDEYIEENTDKEIIDWWNNDIKKNLTSFVNSKLYEVDIPEDNEMIIEGVGFNKQPAKVKKAIRKLLNDKNNNLTEEIRNNIIYSLGKNNYNGRSFYNDIATNFKWDEKQAVELLNDYGIEGIRYKGEEDGECAVVFDDKAISIIERYNQAINTDLELNQEINILDISNTIKGKITKESIKNKIQELIDKKEPIETLSEPWMMELLNKKKNHIIHSSKEFKNFVELKQHNNQLLNIDRLIRNSILIEKVENTKKDKKPNVDNYYYFYTPVKDGNNIYIVKLFAEQEKNNKENVVNLYDVLTVKELSTKHSENKTPIMSTQGGRVADNSSVLTIKQILSNVKDINGNNALESYLKEKNDFFNQENSKDQQEIKGRTIFTDSKAVIELFKNKADQSTLLHESAHYFLKLIQNFANDGYIIAQEQLQDIKEWTASELTKDPSLYIHERFARGFEQYIRSGKTNNNYLKEIFDYFKNFLERIYRNADELEIDVNNKQMFEFFDKYLYHPENYNNWIYDGDDDEKFGKVDNDDKNELEDNSENNSNNKSEDLVELILNQGTEDEGLQKLINTRIKELEKEGRDQDYIDERIAIEFAENEIENIKETAESIEDTSIEELVENMLFDEEYDKYKNNNDNKKRLESESTYKRNKINNFLTKYSETREQIYENKRLYNEGENRIQEYKKEGSDNIEDRIKNIRDAGAKVIYKLFDKEIIEEKEFIKNIFLEKNKIRKEIEIEAKANNLDYGIHPFKNIQEMLQDYEISFNDLTYKQKKALSNRMKKTDNFGDSNADYRLTYEEYDKIVNFRKKFILEKLDDMQKLFKEYKKDIDKKIISLEKEKQNSLKEYDKALGIIEKQKEEILDYQLAEEKIKKNNQAINLIEEVETSFNEIRDINLRNKLIKFASTGRSSKYVLDKLNEYKKKELKKNIQNTIDKILLGTVHISKKTGKIYNNTIYEDSGFLRELKKINNYSKKKAMDELVTLTNNRYAGRVIEPQKQFELKKQLLFFKGTDDIPLNYMMEIVNSLGNFVKESQKLQDEIKANNFYNIIKEKKELKYTIENSKLSDKENPALGIITGHFGNLKTILEFIGGKNLANKYDMLNNEMAFSAGVKVKQDLLFKEISDAFTSNSITKNINEIVNPKLKNRENEVVESIEIQDYFKDKKESKDITLKEVIDIIDRTVRKNENGVRILKNNNTNETVILSNKSINKMFNTTMKSDLENIGGILGKSCISNIKELFANSILITEMDDIKHRTDNRIRRYATAIKSRGETFIVKFTVKELATKTTELTEIELTDNKNKNLSMYDLKVGRKSLAEPSTETVVNRPNDNITINDLIKFVKRDDEKYFEKNKKNNKDIDKIIEKTFKDWTKPITRVEYKRQNKETEETTYSTIETKINFETLKYAIKREIEILNNEYRREELLKILNDIHTTPIKGNIRNYKYKISNRNLENLLNIINHLQYYNDNINLQQISDIIKYTDTKEYKTQLEDYEIDIWGLMQYDLQKKNKATNKNIEMYYTKDTIDKLNSLLKKQSELFYKVEDILFNSVQDRNEINPYYVIEFNRDMGEVQNYFPRRSIHENEAGLFDTLYDTENRDRKFSAIENRSFNAIPNFNVNPLALTIAHQQQTEYIKNIAPKLKNIRNIFDANILDLIEKKKGKDIKKALENHLDNLKYNINNPNTSFYKLINYYLGNWAGSVTNTPSVFMKQLTSFTPYSEGINKLKFIKNYIEGILHPLKTKEFMETISPYIQERFKNGNYDDILKSLNKNDGKLESFLDWWDDKIKNRLGAKFFEKYNLVKWGDILSVIYGGYARYKTLIDEGISKEKAITDFERQTAETQQSNFRSLQPRFTLKPSFEGKLGSMFKSQDMQYYNKFLQNLIEYKNGKSKVKFYNNLVLYHLVIPIFLSLVQSTLIDNLIYDKKEKKWWQRVSEGLLAIGTSFLPFRFLSAGVQISFDLFLRLIDDPKNLETNILKVLNIISGVPYENIHRLLKKRYYQSTIFNTEKEKQQKEKHRKEKEK